MKKQVRLLKYKDNKSVEHRQIQFHEERTPLRTKVEMTNNLMIRKQKHG